MSTILTDDERPEMPEPRVPMDNHQSTWDKYSSAQMEAYADAREAAVLAKLAQQEPVAWWYMREFEQGLSFAKDQDPHKDWQPLFPAPQQAERHALQNQGKHPAPCARFCESKAYEIEIRQLKSQLEQADRQRVPQDREEWLAVREGHFNAAADEYFNARPILDTAANRRIFYAGHCKGYDAAAPEAPAQAVVPEKLVPCELPQHNGQWMAEDGRRFVLSAAPEAPAQASAQCDGAKSLLMEISGDLQIMMGSAVELHDSKGDVAGYQVMTGALHRIFGHLSAAGVPVSIPSRMKKSVLVKGSTKASPELLASVSNILALADSPQGHRGMDGETHYKAPAQASAVDERAAFDAELRRQCFQKPTPEAHDLAWCMWQARSALAQKGGAS